ncbi:UNVERIFIED_ORG: histidinol-phosphate aminotransferase [Pantoea agglomerans]|uniref:histidinol-phosphate transaminase n=1 Tax=Enterobacter agglomerans TaxID=549 RepID=A0ABD6XV60_ENTAG|nr:histidinol-phosphate transaminase [Pantoea agglomerans]WNK71188.1 histidinol-phosphate transaminase [Pantoea agglomerans]
MNFNASDVHVSHRLHLNESDSGNLYDFREVFCDEFSKISTYPDPGNTEMINAISRHYAISPEQIVPGNGVDETILLLCLTLLKKKKSIITSMSTFPGYETAARVCGGSVIHTELSGSLKCCIDNFVKSVNQDTAIAFLCNPHNPTGSVLSRSEVISFIEKMNELNVIPVIDEAYIQFADENRHSVLSYIADGGNAIVLRTFSKAYGLAGLRVGFAFGAEQLIREVANTALALPFRINRFAQKMVPIILQHNDIFLKNILKTKGWIQYIETQFVSLGIEFIPSSTNFVCFRPPQGSCEYTEAAATAGAAMRDCGLFGLPGWVRASVSSQQDADLLLSLTGRHYNEANR